MQPDEPAPDSIPTPGDPKPPETHPDFPEIPKPERPATPFPSRARTDARAVEADHGAAPAEGMNP